MPDLLAPYRDVIERTRVPILAGQVLPDPPIGNDRSQLGGQPWWPADLEMPIGQSGERLHLLAQINFAELPQMTPMPTAGLLQFFIGDDDLYGANVDDPSQKIAFACIYHKTTNVPARSFEAFEWPEKLYSPLEAPQRPRALSFSASSMVADVSDYRFHRLLPEMSAAFEADDALFDAYADWCRAPAIRIGGYSSFTQQDPRSYRQARDLGDFSLLTIETTDGIMWGDCGIAQFFTTHEAIDRQDFSAVAYNWDCS